MFFLFILVKFLLNFPNSYQTSLKFQSFPDGVAVSESEFLILTLNENNETVKTPMNISGITQEPLTLKFPSGNCTPREWLYFPNEKRFFYFRSNGTVNNVTLFNETFNYLGMLSARKPDIYGKYPFLFLLSSNKSFIYTLFDESKEGTMYLIEMAGISPFVKETHDLGLSNGLHVSYIEFDTYYNNYFGLYLHHKENCVFFSGILKFKSPAESTESFIPEEEIFSSQQTENCGYSKIIKLKNDYLSFVIRGSTDLHFLFGKFDKDKSKTSVFKSPIFNKSCSSDYYHVVAETSNYRPIGKSNDHIISIFRKTETSKTLVFLNIEVSYEPFNATIVFERTIEMNDSPTYFRLKKFWRFFVFLYSYETENEKGVNYMLINKLSCFNRVYEAPIDSEYPLNVSDLVKKSDVYMSETVAILLPYSYEGLFTDENQNQLSGKTVNSSINLIYHTPSTVGVFSIDYSSMNFEGLFMESCVLTFNITFDKSKDKTQIEIENKIKNILRQMNTNDTPKTNINDNYTIQVYSTKNPPGKNKSGTSIIDLGECKKELLKHYPELSEDDELFIATVDIKVKDSKTNKVEYKIFDSKRNTELDLKYCKGKKIEVSYALTDANLTKAKEMMEKNSVDIYNPKDSFFNDICIPYSTNKVDVVLSDRRKDIYENVSICEEDCEYQGIDFQTEKANCSCFVKVIFNTSIRENFVNETKQKNSFSNHIIPINIDVMKCYKEFFSFSNLKSNIGFWFSNSLILINCSLFGFFFKEFGT